MSEWPDLVAELISFDDANPFQPIKLGGDIRDPSDFAAADHGTLTAVVRYHTPYTGILMCPAPLSLFPLVWALMSLLTPFPDSQCFVISILLFLLIQTLSTVALSTLNFRSLALPLRLVSLLIALSTLPPLLTIMPVLTACTIHRILP